MPSTDLSLLLKSILDAIASKPSLFLLYLAPVAAKSSGVKAKHPNSSALSVGAIETY